ncbi:MAG: SUMF1/EgtB/PvdO family nonheme iron enzyme [Verrucomicrobiota bacterium]|nr:SUMF1/EgtB/PvdO family nonheme iron enzyme [Verrucomicrobiota bacterium]
MKNVDTILNQLNRSYINGYISESVYEKLKNQLFSKLRKETATKSKLESKKNIPIVEPAMPVSMDTATQSLSRDPGKKLGVKKNRSHDEFVFPPENTTKILKIKPGVPLTTSEIGLYSDTETLTRKEMTTLTQMLQLDEKSLPKRFEDSFFQIFSFIKAGSFLSGEEKERFHIPHDYYIGKFPVTRAQFEYFLADSGYYYPEEELQEMHRVSPEADCPVVNVSWKDASAYCRWLWKTTKKQYRLPTAREWEKTARGTDGRTYPWGNKKPNNELACYKGGAIKGRTARIGAFPKGQSPHKCYDMAGGVWEWCVDRFEDDSRDPHLMMGGSWLATSDFCKTYSQCICYPPTRRLNYVGFRIVLILS